MEYFVGDDDHTTTAGLSPAPGAGLTQPLRSFLARPAAAAAWTILGPSHGAPDSRINFHFDSAHEQRERPCQQRSLTMSI